MAVYLGDSGQVTLSRDSSDEWLATTLDAADVNVNQRRFSVSTVTAFPRATWL